MLKIIHLPNKSTRFEDVYYVSTDLMSPVFAIVTVNKFDDVTHCSCLKTDCHHVQAVESELMGDEIIPCRECCAPMDFVRREIEDAYVCDCGEEVAA